MWKDQDFPISVEVQLLGGLPNGKPRSTANICSPGTQVFINGTMVKGHCLNSKSQTYAGDQWVRVEVEVRGGERLIHKVEGQTVLEYEKPTIGGGEVNKFDPAVKVDGTLLTDGYITIQGESHPTEFRKSKFSISRAAWIRSRRSTRATTFIRVRGRVARSAFGGRRSGFGKPSRRP